MKLICLKDNLKEAVNVAERLTGRNPTLPILSYFLLNAEKNSLRLTATDLEMGITIQVNSKIEKGGEAVLPAKLFNNIINNISEEKLTIEAKDTNITIQTKQNSFQLSGLDAKEFPLLPKIVEEKTLELETAPFQYALEQVLPAASFSEARPELSGVLCKVEKNRMKVVATDSFRLAEKTLSKGFKIQTEEQFSFIIPSRMAQEIIRVLDGKDKAVMKISKNQISVSTEGISLVGRLTEGEYPNYEQIIPKGHLTRVVVQKEEFTTAVRLAGLFASKVNDVKIVVGEDGAQMEIIAAEQDRGTSSTLVQAKTDGKQTTLSFNHKYLLDGLASIHDEELVIEFNGESTPTVLRPVSDEQYFYLVMPIKNI